MIAKKKVVTNFILFSLEKAVDGYIRFEDFANHNYRYLYGAPELKKSSLSKALKRLREKGLIELVSNEKLAYRITQSGRERAILASLSIADENWDGIWRLVIFDIPETRKQARNLLRNKLKQWGFSPWQKSVWASKKNCTKILRDFIKSTGIEDWVMVIESNNTGR